MSRVIDSLKDTEPGSQLDEVLTKWQNFDFTVKVNEEWLLDASGHLSGLGLALREYRKLNVADREPKSSPLVGRTEPEVTKVAELLRGRKVALIGGDTTPHQSYQTFRPVIEQSEVAVVLLAIRWVSHSYSEIGQFCKAAGKPLVRLPGG